MHAFLGREFDDGIPGEGQAGWLSHANQHIHRRIIRGKRGRTAGPLSDRRRRCSTGWLDVAREAAAQEKARRWKPKCPGKGVPSKWAEEPSNLYLTTQNLAKQ